MALNPYELFFYYVNMILPIIITSLFKPHIFMLIFFPKLFYQIISHRIKIQLSNKCSINLAKIIIALLYVDDLTFLNFKFNYLLNQYLLLLIY